MGRGGSSVAICSAISLATHFLGMQSLMSQRIEFTLFSYNTDYLHFLDVDEEHVVRPVRWIMSIHEPLRFIFDFKCKRWRELLTIVFEPFTNQSNHLSLLAAV